MGCVADRHEPRTALKGVLIDINGETTLKIVATTGQVLFVAHESLDNVAPIGQIIIPAEAVKQALKHVKRDNYLVLQSTPAPNEYRLGSLCFNPIDGPYPNYVPVIPSVVSGEPGQFDPNLLLMAWKAMVTVGSSRPHFHFNGTQGAAVYVSSDVQALALVMPWVSPDIPAYPSTPSWI
ncbi:MAG: hypothetical protein ACREQA_16030 [Candidatus Binatia bacterium]